MAQLEGPFRDHLMDKVSELDSIADVMQQALDAIEQSGRVGAIRIGACLRSPALSSQSAILRRFKLRGLATWFLPQLGGQRRTLPIAVSLHFVERNRLSHCSGPAAGEHNITML